MYRYLDAQLAEIKKKVRAEFNRLGLMGFDELNVVNTKKVTQEMYERLLTVNEKSYKKVADDSYAKAKKNAAAAGYDAEEDSRLEGDWLFTVLLAYNFVTGYLYDKEAERKRLRLNEQILTAREYDSRQMFNDSLRKSANLWWTQTSQYGIDVVDAATMRGYKDAGVKEVRWVAKIDGKTCPVCRERDGQIYKLSKVPRKTHYNCRCRLEPVRTEEKTGADS
jgi:SPP1 gp7 family putative phage head morphogenesis protein